MKGKDRGDGKKIASGGGKLGNVKGPNIAGFARQTAQDSQDLKKVCGKLDKLLAGTPLKTAGGGGGDGGGRGLWTCTACGNERCFATRQECHKCGVPRAGALPKAAPPKSAAAAAAGGGGDSS